MRRVLALAACLAACDPLEIPVPDAGVARCPVPCPDACPDACTPDGFCKSQSAHVTFETAAVIGGSYGSEIAAPGPFPSSATVRFSGELPIEIEGWTETSSSFEVWFEVAGQGRTQFRDGTPPLTWSGGGTVTSGEDGAAWFEGRFWKCEVDHVPTTCRIRDGSALTVTLADDTGHREAPPCVSP